MYYQISLLSVEPCKMKRLPALAVLLLPLLVGNPAYSAEHRKGMDAYQRGDYATALNELIPLAEQGNAAAQSALGLMYRRGLGVPKNRKAAIKRYTLAAEQGLAQAQTGLGVMLATGGRGKKNNTSAYIWWSIAALQGDEEGRKHRDMIEERLSPGQITEGKRLAREWVEEHGK
jgi:hypothetical protein